MAKQDSKSTGNRASGSNPPDDPRQAMASGEPSIVGRSHGRVIDDDGTPAGEEDQGQQSRSRGEKSATSGKSGKVGEDFESGRQDTL